MNKVNQKFNNMHFKKSIKKLFTFLTGQVHFPLFTRFRAKRESGHTLIELMVVITIIFILSSVTLYNYYSRRGEEALLLETQKVAQMIRRAQNLALSPQLGIDGTVLYLYPFGIYFNESQNQNIILFTDKNRDNLYSGLTEKTEELQLYKDVQISDLKIGLNDSNNLSIVYIPPDPSTKIFNLDGTTTGSSAKITVGLKNDLSKTRTIDVSLTGLVEVK